MSALTASNRLEFTWKRKKLFDKFIACVLYKHMMRSGGEGIITNVSRLEKVKYKPYPLTTVNFQKLAVKKLHMSSEQAMKIAENLYQQGIISYPRTETNSFPRTMNLRNIISNICDEPYEDYISSRDDGTNPSEDAQPARTDPESARRGRATVQAAAIGEQR